MAVGLVVVGLSSGRVKCATGPGDLSSMSQISRVSR